jgi:serine/threonine-protein phosphatase 2B regulatory subunit
MGGIGSQLKKEEIEELIRISRCNLKSVSQAELKRIYRRFERLDHEGKGWVSVDDVLTLQEIRENPLRDRIARLMTVDMGEVVDFRLFVETISVFNGRVADEEKAKYFFRLYDMDGDGFVGDSELFVVFRMLTRGSYNDAQIQNIVELIIGQFDRDREKRLNYQEFSAVLKDPEMAML